MQKEVDTLVNHGIWTLVDLPEGAHYIASMWMYDLKLNGKGEIIKPKGCLVAQGDLMLKGEDYGNKWAMVACLESVCMVMAVAVVKGLVLKQWDFSSTYLNGYLDIHATAEGIHKAGGGD